MVWEVSGVATGSASLAQPVRMAPLMRAVRAKRGRRFFMAIILVGFDVNWAGLEESGPIVEIPS